MKKIAPIIMLSLLLTNTALAETAEAASGNAGVKSMVGINFSFDNVFGTQFEFDIAKAVNNAPVSVQLFFKSYTQKLGANNAWNTTGTGAAGIYDLSAVSKLDKEFHPYVGLGWLSVSYSWAGFGPIQNYSGVSSGLYAAGGVRYDFNPHLAADVNYNNFGGVTVGANFSF